MIGIACVFANVAVRSGSQHFHRARRSFAEMVRRAGVCLGLAACVVAASPLYAQSGPDPILLQFKVARARGQRPASERIVTNFTRGGLPGMQTEIRSNADYRVDVAVGPFVSAHGMAGGIAWQQNENGETLRLGYDSEEEAEDRTDETTQTVVLHEATPVEQYVIEHLTPSGMGTKDYVDATTYRIVRHEAITVTGTRTITYDDFRTTAGFVRPWHWTVRDGYPDDDADYRVASIETLPIASRDLAVPKQRRTLVDFPAGAQSVTLPATYDRDRQRFVVRVNVGKRGLDFVLDTGASRIIIDRDVAKQLGLTEYQLSTNSANAGRFTTTRTIVPTLNIGQLTLRDVVADTIPHVGGETGPFRIVGLLGFDFLEDIGLALDYKNGVATAYEPAAFVAPTAPGTIALDVRLGSHQPEADISINGAVGRRFVLDTGGAGAVLIDDYFRRLHPEAVVNGDKSDPRSQTMFGLGGQFETKLYKIKSMSVGSATFSGFYANVITTETAYTGNQDGMIGPDFLSLFTVYTDYSHGKMYLSPNDPKNLEIRNVFDRQTAPPISAPSPDDLDATFAPPRPVIPGHAYGH